MCIFFELFTHLFDLYFIVVFTYSPHVLQLYTLILSTASVISIPELLIVVFLPSFVLIFFTLPSSSTLSNPTYLHTSLSASLVPPVNPYLPLHRPSFSQSNTSLINLPTYFTALFLHRAKLYLPLHLPPWLSRSPC